VSYPAFAVLDDGSEEDDAEHTIADIDAGRALLRDPAGRTFLTLSGLDLSGAYLDGARLTDACHPEARLDHADLSIANLDGADVRDAQLVGADLSNASLDGAILDGAQLAGADLSGARLDRDTGLNDATLVGVSADQIVLDNTNLTVLSWEGVAPLGEEP
jgi:uncharacterized protein YjbI with pentapeptide repeats